MQNLPLQTGEKRQNSSQRTPRAVNTPSAFASSFHSISRKNTKVDSFGRAPMYADKISTGTKARVICLLGVCFLFAACGGYYFFGFVSNPGGTQTVTGIVSVVTFSFVQDPTGMSTNVTAVTFLNSGSSNTITFCGDQRSKFHINNSEKVTFTTGALCSSLVSP